MADLVALGVQTPQINTAANFQASQNNAINQAGALQQQHQAALEHIASISLGVLGGDPNGNPDPQRLATMKTLLASGGNNPETAQFIKMLDADPKGTLQGAINMSLQALQMGMAQKQFALQSEVDKSTIAKNYGEASMYANGGPASGSPFQDANGDWWQATQNGQMRQLSGAPGAQPPQSPPTGAAPMNAAPAQPPMPTQVAPSDIGLAPSVAGNAPQAAPAAPAISPAASAPFLPPVVASQRTGYASQRGQDLAKTMATMQADAQSAPTDIAQMDALTAALKSTPQGWGADQFQNARKMATSLGLDVGNVGDGDLVSSISNQMAMKMRNPASGGGMPGSMSDGDRMFLSQTVPGLQQSKNGNKYIIEGFKLFAERKVQIAQMAADYADKHNGQIDDNFLKQVGDYNISHPIYADLTKQIEADNVLPASSKNTTTPQTDPSKMTDEEIKKQLGIN